MKDGVVTREGKTAGGRDGARRRNDIGYAAIVPKAAECGDLFVTFALSASHNGFQQHSHGTGVYGEQPIGGDGRLPSDLMQTSPCKALTTQSYASDCWPMGKF